MSQETSIVLMPDVITDPDIETDIFGDSVRMIAPGAKETSTIPDETWASADAIMCWHDLYYPADLVGAMVNCKVIVRNGVGYDNVDFRRAGELGIMVCNIPDYGTNEVADHTMAFLLGLARGITTFTNAIRSGQWDFRSADPLRRLSGATLGIIGLGRIGTATALRAKAFGMNVCFYDPYVPDGKDKALGVTHCYERNELLAQADVVSVHTPLNEETRNLANSEFFAAMKPGGLFINTARGGIVDIDALKDALQSGHLRGAAIDVWPTEPPADDALISAFRAREPWLADRLIISPHSAFYCDESIREIREKGAREVKRVLEGNPPRNCVNTEWLETARAGPAVLDALRKGRKGG